MNYTDNYTDCQKLWTPRTRVIPFAIWERQIDECLHLHTAPDDPEFPAPTDWDSCRELMARFPRAHSAHKAQARAFLAQR